MSAAAIVGAIVVFCFIVFVAHRIPKVSTVSRVVMPVLAAMLVFLPFLSERYNLVFSMLLLGSYYFVALLITYLIAEAAQTRKVSPYVLMGVAMGVARVCLAVALLSGYAAGVAGGGPGDEAEHTMRYHRRGAVCSVHGARVLLARSQATTRRRGFCRCAERERGRNRFGFGARDRLDA